VTVAPIPIGAARASLAWRIAPATLEFFLDLVAIGRSDRDVVDSLLFGAIIVANLTGVNRDPDLAHAYAAIDQATPDDLRRPVSINAIAQSLRLPFETARRRIRRLAKTGAVTITPRGVFVPVDAIADPTFIARAVARHERLRLFYGTVKSLGALPEAGTAAPGGPVAPPVRVTNRAMAEYMLRFVNDVVAVTGEPISGLIMLQLVRSNAAGLASDDLEAWARAPARLGLPVRTSDLAQALRMPHETVRRHMLSLETAGFCVRSPRGFCAVAPPWAAPAVGHLVEANLANVQRLFARLRQLGVLAAWDS